ncbi:MAG: PLP-dependent aminotransferase family protein [Synergistaceae bacterium]|nr:PLP-dependent aminotransferase family protein [Synergistaceae bacterium]
MSEVWKENFSQCSKNSRPSPIREILAVVKQPGMISFAGGMPAPEVFPVDKFWECLQDIKKEGRELMQYGLTEGDQRLREFLLNWTAPRLGKSAAMNQILLTTGSQQALDLFAWSMLDAGDYVVAEDPTYLAAINVFRNHRAEFLGVPMDAEGMEVDKLPGIIEKARSEGKKLKFIYTIVNFQNPGGATLSVERRKKLVEIAAKYRIPIFEDDPYGYVRYDGEHLPSIYSFDKEELVLYAGSFSKILSPGLRIGWVTGNETIVRQMTIFKQTTDLCSSALTQGATYEYCRRGFLESHLPNIVSNYKAKRDAMELNFEKHLAPRGVKWVKPGGGFFFWLDLGGIDSMELAKKGIEKKVAFIPGIPFCIDPATGRNKARLNYTFSSPEIIEEGVVRLAEAIDEMRIPAK